MCCPVTVVHEMEAIIRGLGVLAHPTFSGGGRLGGAVCSLKKNVVRELILFTFHFRNQELRVPNEGSDSSAAPVDLIGTCLVRM